MTLADFGTIAEIVSAVAVLVTLVYLALQTRHGNKLAQMQTRQHMADTAREELSIVISDPELLLTLLAPRPLSVADAIRVANFLILVVRQREWEWYQAANGAISAAAAKQVKRDCLEVAALFLDIRRARKWWDMTGRLGFNPQFVAELDGFLAGRPFIDPPADYMAIEAALVEENKQIGEAQVAIGQAKAMTLTDFGTIAEIVSAFAVVVTLAYLAIQTRHANKLAQMQTREQMVHMANEELRLMIDDPEMAARFIKPAPLEFADGTKFYNFLTLAMRHREWEWYQAKNGAISKADAEQVRRYCFQVAGIWLSYRRARNWWDKGGRLAFNPQFAAEIDAYLVGNRSPEIIENTVSLEAAMAEEDKRQAVAAKRGRPRAKG